MREDWDDGQFLAALREAMGARLAVPSWFTDMAAAAYAWHDIDAQLDPSWITLDPSWRARGLTFRARWPAVWRH